MAATTAVNIAFQARDWELLAGWMGSPSGSDYQELFYELQKYYRAQTTKPTGTDIVSIPSLQRVAVALFEFLYNATLKFVARDSGASPFTRMITAIRALNTGDNYISDSIAALEANYVNIYNDRRKAGRTAIMMRDYDNT